ncbi:glycosyltransferase [Aquihabitans daechungensis]|uniref:glycosyltransferase n=1 Tax=Aquihabitans daechungensis TaxID=1052257 RepID=UPI003B9F701E
MSRFLFVVPPFTGHVNPTIGVAGELQARGHAVAWAGVPGATEALLPTGSTFFSAVPDEVAAYVAEAGERRDDARGAAGFKFLQEEVLLPLADHMVEGVDAAIDAFGADVLVVDQQALGGAVAARRRGMPWATSATTSAELVDPLAALPKVADAMHQLRVDLQVRHGIAPDAAAAGDLRLSPHLVLAYTVEELTGSLAGTPAGDVPVRFVGPCAVGRPEPGAFPWDRLSDDPAVPNVLVSLGTLNAEVGERFWVAAADAFRDQPWTGVFVAPDHLVPDAPPNVIVQARVPQLELLPRVRAVVSHAGHNTVCETLATGIPLVVAPIRDDQPVVADQVVRAGAAVRVKFARVRADALQEAVAQALADPALLAAAERIQASFAAAGGPAAAADALLSLT